MFYSYKGLSYFKRESAKSTFLSNKNQDEYFQNYKDDELTDLSTLYNGDRVEQTILNIIQNRSKLIEKHIPGSQNLDYQKNGKKL